MFRTSAKVMSANSALVKGSHGVKLCIGRWGCSTTVGREERECLLNSIPKCPPPLPGRTHIRTPGAWREETIRLERGTNQCRRGLGYGSHRRAERMREGAASNGEGKEDESASFGSSLRNTNPLGPQDIGCPLPVASPFCSFPSAFSPKTTEAHSTCNSCQYLIKSNWGTGKEGGRKCSQNNRV